MAILLTSGNPLGLRAVGSGGRTAVASYEQITRTLRQTLGPEHAALFAEPSQRTGRLDWFADVETGGKPVRLVAAATDIRDRGLDRLEALVRDIETKAGALQKSDRQDERILGDMLAHALEIPDEDAVFLVGEQPVMTFWGYVKDLGRPAVGPIHSLLRRRSRPTLVAAAEPVAKLAQAPVETIVETAPKAEARARTRIQDIRLPPAAMWGLLALLLLTCAVELLRGCAFGLPHALTGWLVNACPAPLDSGVADERTRQAELQAQYDELIRQAALARQACVITQRRNQEPIVEPQDDSGPDEPQPVKKDVPDAPPQQMKLPPTKTNSIQFLEGCWRAHEGLTERIADKDTGKKLNITYCFDKDGNGTRTVRYVDDNAKCVGPAKGAWNGDSLTIDIGDATCEGPHGPYAPVVDHCRRGDDGVARCDETQSGRPKPNFVDFPFTRTSEPP